MLRKYLFAYPIIFVSFTSGCTSLIERSEVISDQKPKDVVVPNIKKLRARVRYLGEAYYLGEELKHILPFELVNLKEQQHIHHEPKVSTFSDKNPEADLKIDVVLDVRTIKSESVFWNIISLGLYPAKYTSQVTAAIRVTNERAPFTKTYFRQGWVKYAEGWIPQSEKMGVHYNPTEEMGTEFVNALASEIAKDSYGK